MPDLFVPPSKTAPATESVILEALPPTDEVPDDTAEPILEVTTVPVEDLLAADPPATVAPPLPVEDPPAPDSTGDGEAVLTIALETDAVPPAEFSRDRAPATVDTLFFYGRTGSGDSTLYEVDLSSGTLSPVTTPLDLFPTTLDGLFAAEPLAPPIGADQPDNDRVFTLVQGSSSKNFLIGTTASEALFGLGGDDLVLTGAGHNLAFGGPGNDTLVGGTGDDGLFGGTGDDVIDGGAGDDLLLGGLGNDVLDGGGGSNILVGGAGADIFRLNTPGGYGGASVGGLSSAEPDILVDFNAAEGDRLDFSLIAAQSLFAGLELLSFLDFVQVGADTHVQVSTPLGQITTEAILLGVEADTITAESLTFTPPTGLPLLK
ncbi:type I secretion C-terminal target domain-containing protein [Leptolyngbya sp. CCNP1308]|uniref:calcium-binding protein n=1 Tax=Leptolyngbya sp. CCNP1308 TaxID=3110255 RepID=UPI002B209A68|nr:type I secretion C-terminal target domain-containing protein [Leptolyngbya sp. CCNP1308]MEA5447995.1 type I secretion C-terminal target domain-containing protein [Leptolyngbya sp. CCNP1308]